MKIGIVGSGLIGGSFAMAIREKRREDAVLLTDIDGATMARAKLLSLYDEELSAETLSACDLILIALYPGATMEWLEANAKYISQNAIVVDTAGIKREICALGARLSQEYGFRFVGGHPMAGREVWGLPSASATLFVGASMILTPGIDIDMPTLVKLKEFFLSLGFGGVKIGEPTEHDRIIAYTSELAHILSSAYVESPTAELHRGYSAGSFRDMTRVAAINAEMWSEIFLRNRDMLTEEIDTLIASLAAFREVIASEDRKTLTDMLARGAAKKAELNRRT